jgi:hypothetical protein
MASFLKWMQRLLRPRPGPPQGGKPSSGSERPYSDKAAIQFRHRSAAEKGYPNTFDTAKVAGWEQTQVEVFDPALQHYPRGFHLSDPRFEQPEVAERWKASRSRVIDHLVRLVGSSPWKPNLVLRGSLLMKAWLGDAAREPGDIDWVVVPSSIEMMGLDGRKMLNGVVQLARDNPSGDGFELLVDGIMMDDIWTYERAPGRRIAFPWRAEDGLQGAVQMDIVFGEKLPSSPVLTPIPDSVGGATLLWAATMELALAWKLLWLESDMHPQGKDLYDATLLAEQTRLSYALLQQVLDNGDYMGPYEMTADSPLQWDIDWDNFKLDYTWVAGEASDWKARLMTALAPTFAQSTPD